MKTAIDSITVEGKEYVPKDSLRQQEYDGEYKIVILQRGWVMIGKFERDGSECKLHNAAVIRKWGTTKGLPELCNGKLNDTILDKCSGIVEFDYLTVVALIAVKEDVWEKELE
jgi:hypothetical protein